MRHAATLLLLLAAAITCRAQIEGMPDLSNLGIPDGIGDVISDIFGHPNQASNIEKCGQFLDNTEAQTSCTDEEQLNSGTCPDSCKTYWQGLPAECVALIKPVFDNLSPGALDAVTGACGEPGSNPIPVSTPPEDPIVDPVVDDPMVDPIPILNYTGWSSNFTCETDGFAWVTLDPTLASSSAGAAADAAAAINSTCQDLNTTGCCTEVAGNYTWVQYGLGAPMYVRGIKVTAPAGNCCSDGDCTLGTEPCNEQLLNAWVYVANTSISDVIADVTAQYKATMGAIPGFTDAALAEAVNGLAYSAYMGNASAGFCNMVNTYDMFGDGVDGSMLNNGSLSIGCGMGMLSGNSSITVNGDEGLAGLAGLAGGTTTISGLGGVGGLIVLQPQGSYVTLSKYLSMGETLSLCGIQVCAKPAGAANTTSTPAT